MVQSLDLPCDIVDVVRPLERLGGSHGRIHGSSLWATDLATFAKL